MVFRFNGRTARTLVRRKCELRCSSFKNYIHFSSDRCDCLPNCFEIDYGHTFTSSAKLSEHSLRKYGA